MLYLGSDLYSCLMSQAVFLSSSPRDRMSEADKSIKEISLFVDKYKVLPE